MSASDKSTDNSAAEKDVVPGPEPVEPEQTQKINEESYESRRGGLSEFITKTLLRDFEASGEDRERFDLLGFCDNNEDVYGVKGSKLRYQVQQRWNKVKRRDVGQYARYLRKVKLSLGENTKSQLRVWRALKNSSSKSSSSKISSSTMTKATKSMDDEQSMSSPGSLSSGSDTYDVVSDTSEVKDQKSKPSDKKNKLQKMAAKDLFSSPVRKAPVAQPIPAEIDTLFPPMRMERVQHVFGETSPLVGQFTSTNTPHALVPVTWLQSQNGTQKNPWIVAVDIERAEGNRDFDIEHVIGIDQDDIYTRNGFDIRRTVAAPDMEEWTATIPTNFSPQYSKRVILFKGPSRDYWQRNTDKYHADGHVGCEATKKAHSATEIAIEELPVRQWSYYLLVFPPSIVLTNLIFSRDEEVVPQGKNPMKSKAADNPFKKDLRAMVLFWKIAIKGGKKVGKGKSTKKKAESMFS
jgi:hypothetical protein